MTTIAYDGKNIAIDSRVSAGKLIVTDSGIKYKYNKNRLFFLCGATDKIDFFYKNFAETQKCEFEGIEVCGFLLADGKVSFVGVDAGKFFSCDTEGITRACGSGGDFAIAAIDHKKSAEHAVKYAMTRDIYSGGHVHVFCAKTCRKIK